jgi:hypothetical protein
MFGTDSHAAIDSAAHVMSAVIAQRGMSGHRLRGVSVLVPSGGVERFEPVMAAATREIAFEIVAEFHRRAALDAEVPSGFVSRNAS